jgi:hypothetical protein
MVSKGHRGILRGESSTLLMPVLRAPIRCVVMEMRRRSRPPAAEPRNQLAQIITTSIRRIYKMPEQEKGDSVSILRWKYGDEAKKSVRLKGRRRRSVREPNHRLSLFLLVYGAAGVQPGPPGQLRAPDPPPRQREWRPIKTPVLKRENPCRPRTVSATTHNPRWHLAKPHHFWESRKSLLPWKEPPCTGTIMRFGVRYTRETLRFAFEVSFLREAMPDT